MRHRRHDDPRSTISRRTLVGGATALAAATLTHRHAAGQATAVAGGDFAVRLGALLAAVPARDLTDAAPLPFYYADLAGQLESVSVERPAPDDRTGTVPDGFFEASIALPLASRAFDTGLDPEWFPTFGFNPYAVDQVLALTQPPNVVSLFRGGFDRQLVEDALVESGYATVLQETGGLYYSFGDEFTPDTPVGRLGVGAMNQAFVTDDLLVFARMETDLASVTQVVAGYQPSMLEQEIWSDMASHFSPDTVGMIPLAPGYVEIAASPALPGATPVAAGTDAGKMQYLAFGVRAGSRSRTLDLGGEGSLMATPAPADAGVPARIEIRIRYGDEETASREAEAIPERWDTMVSLVSGQPYRELMPLEAARVSPRDPRVVEIDLVAEAPNRWSQVIHTRDLAPLAPVVG